MTLDKFVAERDQARASALREVADEFAAMKRAHNGLPAISLDMVMILLRQRADRIAPLEVTA